MEACWLIKTQCLPAIFNNSYKIISEIKGVGALIDEEISALLHTMFPMTCTLCLFMIILSSFKSHLYKLQGKIMKTKIEDFNCKFVKNNKIYPFQKNVATKWRKIVIHLKKNMGSCFVFFSRQTKYDLDWNTHVRLLVLKWIFQWSFPAISNQKPNLFF